MEVLTGSDYLGMLVNGAVYLKRNAKIIDDLNVFPVPDGDTGSNMSSTYMNGIKEVYNLENPSILELSKKFSKGLLIGARGNSGVILSQIFAGLTPLDNKKMDEADLFSINEALYRARLNAYKAVLTPVEGTILTVVKDAAKAVYNNFSAIKSVEELFDIYLKEAEESLKRTTDILPVLKGTSLVDSGAAGFVEILKGMSTYLKGEVHSLSEITTSKSSHKDQSLDFLDFDFYELNKYGYCTEFTIRLNPNLDFDKEKFTKRIEVYGTSIVVVDDKDILKVHIHTKTPGEIFTLAQEYGALCAVKAENMAIQTEENSSLAVQNFKGKIETNEKEKQLNGIVAVVNGQGLKEIFEDLGVNVVIDGGQTMNPSTGDFVEAIKKVNAEHVYVIPNNKNVYLSAKSAKALINDKHVIVVPAFTIPEGYASLLSFDFSETPEENMNEMESKINSIESGEVTYAIRDSVSSGIEIKKGDFISILDGDIVNSFKSRIESVEDLLKAMIKTESISLTVFFGKDVDNEERKIIEDYIGNNFSLEFGLFDGEQEVYSYIIEVE